MLVVVLVVSLEQAVNPLVLPFYGWLLGDSVSVEVVEATVVAQHLRNNLHSLPSLVPAHFTIDFASDCHRDENRLVFVKADAPPPVFGLSMDNSIAAEYFLWSEEVQGSYIVRVVLQLVLFHKLLPANSNVYNRIVERLQSTSPASNC